MIALILLAYLEEDGLLLSIALLAAIITLAVAAGAVWETILGARWLGSVSLRIALADLRSPAITR